MRKSKGCEGRRIGGKTEGKERNERGSLEGEAVLKMGKRKRKRRRESFGTHTEKEVNEKGTGDGKRMRD